MWVWRPRGGGSRGSKGRVQRFVPNQHAARGLQIPPHPPPPRFSRATPPPHHTTTTIHQYNPPRPATDTRRREGTMEGAFQVGELDMEARRRDPARLFEAEIAPFKLKLPPGQ